MASLRDALLPDEPGVIDVEGAGAEPDRFLDPLRAETGVDEPESSVHRLGGHVLDAHAKTEPIEASSVRFPLRMSDECGRHSATPRVGAYFDILQFGGIAERKMKMPDRFVALPGDEVDAIALVQPSQTEEARHGLDLV